MPPKSKMIAVYSGRGNRRSHGLAENTACNCSVNVGNAKKRKESKDAKSTFAEKHLQRCHRRATENKSALRFLDIKRPLTSVPSQISFTRCKSVESVDIFCGSCKVCGFSLLGLSSYVFLPFWPLSAGGPNGCQAGSNRPQTARPANSRFTPPCPPRPQCAPLRWLRYG